MTQYIVKAVLQNNTKPTLLKNEENNSFIFNTLESARIKILNTPHISAAILKREVTDFELCENIYSSNEDTIRGGIIP